MGLKLTSNKAGLNFNVLETLTAAYVARVTADGGTIDNTDLVYSMYADMLSANIDQTKVHFYGAAEAGVKVVAGAVTKMYNLVGANVGGGDMIPVAGTVTKAVSGTRTCIIYNGSCMLITTNGIPSIESSVVIEMRALNAALRTIAQVDGTQTLAGGSNLVGSLQAGSTSGYQAFGYTSAGGSGVTYATYADFKRLTMLTRQAVNVELLEDGVSLVATAVGQDASTTFSNRWFKLGNSSAAGAVSRIFAYAGVLRQAQMKQF